MSRRIIGVTVGTSISPKAIERKLKPVKTVNGVEPDENGNVDVIGDAGADGKTPFIGENGNWWIGEEDTGVKAQGEKGADGTVAFEELTEEQKASLKGDKGDKGETPVKGEDYWTQDDIDEIYSYLDDAVKDAYGKGDDITSGEDLNEYTAIGKYYANSNSVAASLSNCPTTQNFVMWVFVRTNSAPSQVIIDLQGRLHIRSRSSSTWNSWATYLTDKNVTKIVQEELAKYGQLKPEFANSIDECTDTSKLYVLPDGYIYAYMRSAFSIQIETTQGGYYNSNGVWVADSQSTAQRTNLIPVKEGDQFEVTSQAKYNASVIWYTSAETKISHETYGIDTATPETVIVTAPAGAAYVRFYSYGYGATYLAVRPLEESYAWASTGHAFVPADYEDRIITLEEKTDDLANGVSDPLYGKKIVYDGDSICYGAGYTGGYAKIIANLTGGTYVNQAVGGGRLVSKGNNSWHSVVDNLSNLPLDGDIYCFEGGINDFWTSGMQLGAVNPSNYEGALDTTTVCGALETIFRYALNTFVGKPVCFVIAHKIQETAYQTNTSGNTFKEYRDAMVSICEKYSIPYYDAFTESGLNGWNDTQNEEFFTNGDGCHPNEAGYKRYYVPQLLDLFRKIIPQTGAESILYFDAIKKYLDENLKNETWTFEMADGTTVTKQVVVLK